MAPVPLADTRLTGQVLFADQQGQRAVFAQHIVVVETFIAQCQAIHPLRHQCLDTVLNTIGIAVVGEACGQPIQQAEALMAVEDRVRNRDLDVLFRITRSKTRLVLLENAVVQFHQQAPLYILVTNDPLTLVVFHELFGIFPGFQWYEFMPHRP